MKFIQACRTGKVRSALVLMVLFLVGCQTEGNLADRPILPLFSSTLSPPTPAAFGLPTAIEPTAAVAMFRESAPRSATIAEGSTIGASTVPSCFLQEMVINLDRAFRLANVNNPRIGLAEEVVRAQQAEQKLARAMLFPTLNAGVTLSMHRGHLLSASGVLRDVDRESLYVGAGAEVRGGGTAAVPGVQLVGHLADAAFAPRLAEQRVQRSQLDASAAHNDVLLNVARAYLGLVSAEARLLTLRQSESELIELARLTTDFAAKGLGREADTLRTQSELALLKTAMLRVEEDSIAQAVELARLLSEDATVRLRPEPGVLPIVQLVDEDAGVDVLLEAAVANRPEAAARSADVAIQATRLRQERVRPFLPTIALGFSAGEFGGGSNLVGYRLSQFSARTDLDIVAVWNLQNLGVGNRAVQNGVQAQVDTAEANRLQVIDQIRREVADAFARTRTARHQMDIARHRVETAHRAYREDLARTKDRLGRLVEVLSSFNLLVTARQELVQATVSYSQSQFELHVAIGGTPAAPAKE